MLQYRNEVVWLAQAAVYLRSARAAAAGASAATMAVRQHSSTCRCCDGSGQRRAGGMGSSTGRCSAAQRLLGLAPLMPPCSHQAAILASCRQASGRRRSTECVFQPPRAAGSPQSSSLHPPEADGKAAARARAPPGGKGPAATRRRLRPERQTPAPWPFSGCARCQRAPKHTSQMETALLTLCWRWGSPPRLGARPTTMCGERPSACWLHFQAATLAGLKLHACTARQRGMDWRCHVCLCSSMRVVFVAGAMTLHRLCLPAPLLFGSACKLCRIPAKT